MSIMEIINAVKLVEAVQRIKPEHRHEPGPTATFFSEWDVWLFDATLDTKVCNMCRLADQISVFYGDHLRANFPYLEIVDVNTIKANIHPNCRCFLHRKIG